MTEFSGWLTMTMREQRLTQAEVARAVGVADAQVSRWRRGQVVPSVPYLQKLADTFGVQRATLDRLAGYPVGDASGEPDADPERRAELQTYQARYGRLLDETLPRGAWRAYMDACEALALALAATFDQALEDTRRGTEGEYVEGEELFPPERYRDVGFKPPRKGPRLRDVSRREE